MKSSISTNLSIRFEINANFDSTLKLPIYKKKSSHPHEILGTMIHSTYFSLSSYDYFVIVAVQIIYNTGLEK